MMKVEVRELPHRIKLSFFVMEILTTQESIAKLKCPSDGHISTTKKDNKILWHHSLPLLSQINITKPIHYLLANVGGDTF